MSTTLTQRARRTPGARHWMQSAARHDEVSRSLVVAWTIIGKCTRNGTEHLVTASAFGRSESDAITNFLTQQNRCQTCAVNFLRHELRAEVER